MGAINTHAEMITGMNNHNRSDIFTYFNGNVGLLGGNYQTSVYSRYSSGAVIPSASVPCTSATPGCQVYIPLTSSKQLWLTEMEFAGGWGGGGTRFAAVLYDRLVHSGGLVGNVTSEQTTNLPTAALTRYTDGKDVMAFLEVYTVISTVNTTCTIRYTNQDGVANRISKPMVLLNTQNGSPDSFTPFMLQNGDTGVRSVEGFTMAAASASAGNMGITLCKKLAYLPSDSGSYQERTGYRQTFTYGGTVEIMPGAFLFITFAASQNGTSAWNLQGRLGIVEK